MSTLEAEGSDTVDGSEVAVGAHQVSVPAARAHEMTEVEARDWWETTERIGRELLPCLERLAAQLPSLTSLMISTADGFNLCSMGLDASTVDRVSAMGSALHSVARSVVESLGSASRVEGSGGPPDLLTVTHDGTTTVVLTVPAGAGEHALLWVSGTDDSLGALLFRARAAVDDIAQTLARLAD